MRAEGELRFREILRLPEVRTSVLGTFVVMAGFGILSPILPLYARSFGVGLDAVGLLVAAFSITRLAVDPFTGAIVGRLGERRAVTLGAAAVGVSSALAALAPTFTWLVVFRGLGGAGSAVFFSGLLTYLLRTSPAERVGRVMSVWYGSFNVGIIAGEPLGGVVAHRFGPASTLWIYAGSCFLSAAVFARSMHGTASSPRAERRAGLRRLPWRRPLLAVLLANGAYAWMIAGVWSTLIPLFGKERVGLSEIGIGLALAVGSLAEFAVLFPAGRATDRIGRRAVLAPGYAAMALALVLWPLARTAALFVLANGVFGLISGYAGVPQAPMLSDVTDEDLRGTAVAVFRFVGDLGFVLGPLAAGASADALGYGPAFALAAVPLLLALGLVLTVPETLRAIPRTGEAPGL
ncbi:MAG: putative transporter [Actinomycetota bacterium]|nr:MAG: putative transporter [Actinomycetota bacterium]